MLIEPLKFGVIVGLYLWVAGAPFGFLHPDNENWVFFWRLLPFRRLLVLAALSTAGISALLLAFVSLYRKTEDPQGGESIRFFRRVLSPLYFLLIAPVQLIPGAVGVLPVLPLVNKLILPVVVFSSAMLLLVIETRLLSPTVSQNLHRSIASHKWRWSLAVFLVSLLAYGVFMKRCNMVYGYTAGDEAHYLTQAQSLAEDFDRDLVNQLPDYDHNKIYYIAKHLSPKSPPGKAYSYHSIGLAVLLAPGWALAKMKGAVAVLAIIASLFAVSVFWIAFRVLRRAEFAIGAWAVFCFTTPIILYACRAYPELTGGFVILLVVWMMMKPESLTRSGWLAVGCLIGFLPWLHIPRLAMPTLLLSAWGCVWLFLRGRRKRLIFFLPPLLMSVVLLIVLNQHWYGYSWGQAPGATGFEKLDPQAWTGGYYHQPKELFSCWTGIVGAIMDRYKGLLVCSPAYLIPLLCVLFGLFSRKLKFWRKLWFWVFLVAYIPALSRTGWYGGACFPSRFLISVLPLLLFPFARVLSVRRDKLLRTFFAVLAAFSAWITLRMLINTDHFYRGAESARWHCPATQLISLFYPYAGTYRTVCRIEDPFGILVFTAWVAGVVCLLQWARKKKMLWHHSFNLTITAILALPLFTTAVRRGLNCHPYQFSFTGALEHYSTLIGINRASRAARLHVARWGQIPPETARKELTLELPAVEQKSRTGQIKSGESVNREFLAYDPDKHEPGYLSYTHPLKIHPGGYFASFWVSADGWNPDDSIILDIQDMQTEKSIAIYHLASYHVRKGKKFARIRVPFFLQRYTKLSLRVYVDAKSSVGVLKYSIEPQCLHELLAAIECPAPE